MNIIFDLISKLGYFNIIPVILIIAAAYFIIKGLEMVFKILAYVFVIFVIYYFFGDVIFSLFSSLF